MNSLDLYGKIEADLDFDEQVQALHGIFLNIVEELNPTSVLDVGCGQGAFLEQLNKKNIQNLGIDLSANQINICLKKNLNAKAIDLANLDGKYDCITAIFDVVNYIPQNELDVFFKNIANKLEDGGYFIFDINTLYGFEDVAQGSLNIDLQNRFICIDAFFEDMVLTTNMTLFSQTENNLYNKESGFIKQYFYTTDVLKETLLKYGFEVESILPFTLHDVEDYDKEVYIVKYQLKS